MPKTARPEDGVLRRGRSQNSSLHIWTQVPLLPSVSPWPNSADSGCKFRKIITTRLTCGLNRPYYPSSSKADIKTLSVSFFASQTPTRCFSQVSVQPCTVSINCPFPRSRICHAPLQRLPKPFHDPSRTVSYIARFAHKNYTLRKTQFSGAYTVPPGAYAVSGRLASIDAHPRFNKSMRRTYAALWKQFFTHVRENSVSVCQITSI